MTTIYIIRHGQSHGNVDINLRGTDAELTELGRQQIEEVAKTLKDVHFDALFSSDLVRAQQTAAIINLERKLAVQTTRVLRERNMGSFYIRKTEEQIKESITSLRQKIDELTQEEYWSYKHLEDMESEEEAITRFITFLRELAVAYDGKTLALIGHGNLMRTFLVHLGYGTFRELKSGTLKNGGYIRVDCDGTEFFLKEVVGVKKKVG
jgi:2,3-bisphosphoglycerate-dependent phosphoglycerate mutase